MKTRLLIVLGTIVIILTSSLVANQYYLSLQDKELKQSDWVQNCVPGGPDKAVPLIGLFNHTHSFDLSTCTWNLTENGTPGFLESLYISFIEPIFFDITDSLEMNYAYADCNTNVNYDTVFENSELVFTGTVTRLDNYDGPQKVTFFIHDIIKGKVDTPKHVLENTGMVFLDDDGTVRILSVDVDYKIGKTYKVYVENGNTDECTTKLTIPPADYIWEPGPEDGNYYSDEPEEPLQQYQDANERESYRDALDDSPIVLPSEFPKLTDRELDDIMDDLFSHGLDHTELPMVSIAIDYKRDILVFWTPDLTIGNKVQELVGDVPFVLLYEESPARWEDDGPSPEPILEPKQEQTIHENCGPGTALEDGVCVVNSDYESTDTGVKWGDFYNKKYSSPNSNHFIDYELFYLIVFVIVGLGCGVVGIVILVIWRNRK